MKRLKHVLAATAVALTAGLTGAWAQASAQDTKPIKIGILTDISGLQSDNTGQGSVNAAQVAADEVGTVLGRPVVVVAADHQNKPDVAAAIANKWLDQDGVNVIADLPTSSVALAVQDIVRRKGGINIVSGAASTELIRKSCSPYGFLWTYSTYSQANGVGDALTSQGGDSWYFIQADYAFGEAMAKDLRAAVEARGGKVLGIAKHPQSTADFSSYLLRAQSSGAKVVALLNAGQDTITAVKQAGEFGITEGGQRIATLIFLIPDANALGLPAAKGLTVMNGFYWQQSPEAETWSRAFHARFGRMPTSTQIGIYSAIKHYLKAVEAAGTDDRDAVTKKMRELPVEDAFVSGGKVRPDGLMEHEMLLEEVKSPEESKEQWDVFKIIKRIPGDQAFGPMQDCPLIK
ncbi:ABC transporter substrate-binding protein [Xanthobacteraceae bacterium A53D]